MKLAKVCKKLQACQALIGA